MAAKKRGKSTKAGRAALRTVLQVQRAEARRVPLLMQDLYRAEMRATKAERELEALNAGIRKFLTPDQLDAAAVCGVTPAQYFLEYVSLCKERLFAQAANTLAVKSFPELNRG